MTELMKRYEETTYLDDDPQALIQIIEYLKDCVQGYKAKAAAYDRLMSGIGKMSLQEWANFLGAPVTLDRDGKVEAHYSSPASYSEEEGWWYNPHNQSFEIPRNLADTYGCLFHFSIKYPDGWEER